MTYHTDECQELAVELGITAEDNPDMVAELHAAMAADGMCGEA